MCQDFFAVKLYIRISKARLYEVVLWNKIIKIIFLIFILQEGLESITRNKGKIKSKPMGYLHLQMFS